MSNVKGMAINACKEFILKNYSKDDIDLLKKELGDKIFEVLMYPLPGSFYPIEYFITINKTITKIFGKNDISIIRKIGEFSADEANKGIYKLFFRIGSPQFIIKKSSMIFNKYYDKGELKLIDTTKDSVTLELIDFNYKEDTKFICTRVEGWIEKALAISGAKGVKTIQKKCVSKGDPLCLFYSKW